MDIKDLKIRDFRVNETLFSRILKILTPFSIYFWIAVFLFIVLILNPYNRAAIILESNGVS